MPEHTTRHNAQPMPFTSYIHKPFFKNLCHCHTSTSFLVFQAAVSVPILCMCFSFTSSEAHFQPVITQISLCQTLHYMYKSSNFLFVHCCKLPTSSSYIQVYQNNKHILSFESSIQNTHGSLWNIFICHSLLNLLYKLLMYIMEIPSVPPRNFKSLEICNLTSKFYSSCKVSCIPLSCC